MRKKDLQILILLLIAMLVIVLTLAMLSLIDLIFFWVLAGISAIFAFKVLPKINQSQ